MLTILNFYGIIYPSKQYGGNIMKKKTKDKAESLIKQFHKETNINLILSSSIPTVYVEGNCIKYLRSKNGHYVIDTYPLGVALVSDYSVNGIPYVLIDIRELTSRLQKTTIRGKKNKPLFFGNLTEEIKNNYPELIDEWNIPLDEYPRRCENQIERWAKQKEELLKKHF